jgi:hypothetical protein
MRVAEVDAHVSVGSQVDFPVQANIVINMTTKIKLSAMTGKANHDAGTAGWPTGQGN